MWPRLSLRDENRKYPSPYVEIECIVKDEKRASYLVDGVRHRKGDRARIDLATALVLEKSGKARIIEGTEKTEYE